MNWTLSPQAVFSASPIIPVMVIKHLEDAVPLAKALSDGGINVFEVTLRTDVALDAIRDIVSALPETMTGAGTVLTPQQYDAAVAAGATFVISPGASTRLLEHAAKHSVPLIPGVSTATEIMQAMDLGYDHLKFFPAEANGGVMALKAISAPLPQVSFCPTGGINEQNMPLYQSLDCVKTVGGTWMLPAEAIENKQWDRITELTRAALHTAGW
ncbi:keto-deoxy-phosphogluconate aldolase [Vibrio sp. HA2012]|uniref:bifunctional 4-hydroxy-2-oxoglutarate aldolase/2-dehydro-3-deoxy-phosphogluconate aldolase n=1 Tax=Vibrio sp. HA2012 TaxID=1971595 RepID=UPI000C2C0BCE|nr:bifunctional 4-hydroxy-2-oxoglutarate aldolase/2-dehydro-3-deoxy-phosphogluconate aldolase [Vibrio sp. HA2012]PJC85119.1 keto-deoxy-phosphogluconate aldolase [Vibrio sp. HA2012]